MTTVDTAATGLEPLEIRRESVSAQIVKALTEHFFSSSLVAGSRIPSERQLAESLGVSRAAVREAIQSLGLLGVVDIRQGDGTYLRSGGSDLLPRVIEWGLFLGERRVMDLVEARQHLEIALAGLAARRRNDADLDELQRLVDEMDQAAERAVFVDFDVQFHSAIARAAGNLTLRDTLGSITSLIRLWMTRSLEAAGETRTSNSEHKAILEAIRSGDSRAAQSAMRQHMKGAEKRLRRMLGPDGSGPTTRDSPPA